MGASCWAAGGCAVAWCTGGGGSTSIAVGDGCAAPPSLHDVPSHARAFIGKRTVLVPACAALNAPPQNAGPALAIPVQRVHGGVSHPLMFMPICSTSEPLSVLTK